jgi:hypothetical protein
MILLYAHIGRISLTVAADDIKQWSHSDIESQVKKKSMYMVLLQETNDSKNTIYWKILFLCITL